jgi:hypothetical protein
MKHILRVTCEIEQRDDNGEFAPGNLRVSESVELGDLSFGQAADVLNGFQELANEMKEARREAEEAKKAEEQEPRPV